MSSLSPYPLSPPPRCSYIYTVLCFALFFFCPASKGLDSYGESIVFDDEWLGAASPDNDFHTVDKGRWAFLPVKQVRPFSRLGEGLV